VDTHSSTGYFVEIQDVSNDETYGSHWKEDGITGVPDATISAVLSSRKLSHLTSKLTSHAKEEEMLSLCTGMESPMLRPTHGDGVLGWSSRPLQSQASQIRKSVSVQTQKGDLTCLQIQ
jgi:hypothetical protein